MKFMWNVGDFLKFLCEQLKYDSYNLRTKIVLHSVLFSLAIDVRWKMSFSTLLFAVISYFGWELLILG